MCLNFKQGHIGSKPDWLTSFIETIQMEPLKPINPERLPSLMDICQFSNIGEICKLYV